MKKTSRKTQNLIGSMKGSKTRERRSHLYFSDDELDRSEDSLFTESQKRQMSARTEARPERPRPYTGRQKMEYEPPRSRREQRPHPQGRRRRRKETFGEKLLRKKKLIIILAAIVIVLAAAVVVIGANKKEIVKSIIKSDIGSSLVQSTIGDAYMKNVYDKDFDRSKVAINSGVKTPDGYKTIALLGIDARDGQLRDGSRSDSMMVMAINEETNDVKMGSVYRDTYLVDDCNEKDEYYIGKANAAYVLGGPEKALSMLNRNWDLAVQDYVVVNFGGLANIIDAMGGIKVKVTKKEVKEINYHMVGHLDAFGGKYEKLKGSGEMVLNGAQATTFCRIRSVDFKSPLDGKTYSIDYGRTARQRYVLNEIFKQAKEGGVSKLVDVINAVCEGNTGKNKFIMTSLSLDDLLEYLDIFMDMNIAGQDAFPHTDRSRIADLDAGSSIVADPLEVNVQLLHEFLFGEKNYKVSLDFQKYNGWITRLVELQKYGPLTNENQMLLTPEQKAALEAANDDDGEELTTAEPETTGEAETESTEENVEPGETETEEIIPDPIDPEIPEEIETEAPVDPPADDEPEQPIDPPSDDVPDPPLEEDGL